jgi:hypothetical protein
VAPQPPSVALFCPLDNNVNPYCYPICTRDSCLSARYGRELLGVFLGVVEQKVIDDLLDAHLAAIRVPSRSLPIGIGDGAD